MRKLKHLVNPITLLLCCWANCWFNYVMAEQVRINGPQSQYDTSHAYFKGLIELAFKELNQPVAIVTTPLMAQNRALEQMGSGNSIDIYWTGTSKQREALYGFVPIPLVKGLLGYRVFVVHQDKIAVLKKVRDLEDLRKLSLCQGAHWPDTKIMKAVKLQVTTNTVYENMFKQVYSNRCDAFPRGINEALGEVIARQPIMPKLRLYDKLILRYPFSMYFFTQKSNKDLVEKLTKGLEQAIDDGSFDKYLQEHPTTSHLFPVSKWINSKRIDIPNPFLSEAANPNDKRYWIVP